MCSCSFSIWVPFQGANIVYNCILYLIHPEKKLNQHWFINMFGTCFDLSTWNREFDIDPPKTSVVASQFLSGATVLEAVGWWGFRSAFPNPSNGLCSVQILCKLQDWGLTWNIAVLFVPHLIICFLCRCYFVRDYIIVEHSKLYTDITKFNGPQPKWWKFNVNNSKTTTF